MNAAPAAHTHAILINSATPAVSAACLDGATIQKILSR